MKKMMWRIWGVLALSLGAWSAFAANPERDPARFIQVLGDSVMAQVVSDPRVMAGDSDAVRAIVDERVIPVLAFERMTASSVGPAWRTATPGQRERLEEEFKVLLVRTYAGALQQLKGKSLKVFPVRMGPQDTDVTVRSEIQGLDSEPLPLSYRLYRDGDGWMIYDINVVGIWLVETYRTQFAQQIQKSGIEGLIGALARLNGRS